MKRLFILFTVAISMLFFQACKKDGPDKDAPQKSDSEQLADMFNIQDEALMVYANSFGKHHDTLQAILDMGKWLTKQDGVKEVALIDYNRLALSYENGISTSINIIKEGTDRQHDTRYGSGEYRKGSVTTYLFGAVGNRTSSKTIESNKVLIICPFFSEFYGRNYPYLDMFKDSKVPLAVTLVTDGKCTIGLLETFHQYGLIILNTHGRHTGAFLLHTGIEKFDLPEKPDDPSEKCTKKLFDEWLQKAGSDMVQKIKTGKYEFEYTGLLDYQGKIMRTVQIGVTRIAVRETVQ